MVFGLHHAVAAAAVLGWSWALPALLLPAVAGAAWAWSVRRSGGLGLACLSHAWADAFLAAWAASQLR